MIDFLFPDDFLNEPAARDKGDDNADPIFLAVGRALSAWEFVETGFAHIFHTMCETHSIAAVRAYAVITSSRGRQDLFNAASKIYFAARGNSKEETKFFNHMITKFGGLAAVRNKVAHGNVVLFKAENGDSFGHFLVPGDFTRRTNPFPLSISELDPLRWTGANYRYNSEDINTFHDKFSALREKVWEYSAYLYTTYHSPFR